jgi:hypothetical protein
MRNKSTRILNGYVVVYLPTHPKSMKSKNWNGYIYEHIVVAEKDLGRIIRDDEEVHHLDFNRHNNSPENLLVLTSSSHKKLHLWLRNNNIKPIAKEVIRCSICNYPLSNEQKTYCSDVCYHEGIKSIMESISTKQIEKDFIELKSMVKVAGKYNLSNNGLKKWIKKKFNFSNEDLSKLKEGLIKLK